MMPDKLEKFIKAVYREYKSASSLELATHPNEESMACFLEGRLSDQEAQAVKLHLINCQECARKFAAHLKLEISDEVEVPKEAVEKAKKLVEAGAKLEILEISLWLKETNFELLHTNGDVLVGQELIPAPVLRSRKIKDFRNEVTVLKDFENIRVEVKVENKNMSAFNMSVFVKEKPTLKFLKDLRMTLLKDNIEMESYVTDTGNVVFENVVFGVYTVEISNIDNRFAAIKVDVKI